jgi:hypothetical protein
MASEKTELEAILRVYGSLLMRRAVVAYRRSPGDFLDEILDLQLVMAVRERLAKQKK